MAGLKIELAQSEHIETGARLREELWPDSPQSEHWSELTECLSKPDENFVAFVARTEAGDVVGFAEACLRQDYLNGCDTSPVAFLEGIYVSRVQRRSGVAQALCSAVEDWGRRQGCVELGSDALIENSESQAFHAGVGFEERERIVCYRKRL